MAGAADEKEEIAPIFSHTECAALPFLADKGVEARVVLGTYEGATAPVPVFSDTLYADLKLEAGKSAPLAANWEERALYILAARSMWPATCLRPTSCWSSVRAMRSP